MIDDQVNPASALSRDQRRVEYFIPNFLEPILMKGDTICSAGCGTGYDVAFLNKRGYNAYGFDPGRRREIWNSYDKLVQNKLRYGYSNDFPFGKECFDFIYSLEVIEHVGCKDGIWELLPDYKEVRRFFIEDLLDMLKPKGVLLLTVANRLFPFDPGHGHHYHWATNYFSTRHNFRITIPWHRGNFLLSFSDVKKCALSTRFSTCIAVDLLSAEHFLSFSNLRDTNKFIPVIKFLAKQYYKATNRALALRRSFLNPFLVIRISKDQK